MLDLSGGNPALAYSLYAVGHLMPAFALVLVAGGVNLSLHEPAPHAAAWFTTTGLAMYLAGTRVFSAASRRRQVSLGWSAVIAVTVTSPCLPRSCRLQRWSC